MFRSRKKLVILFSAIAIAAIIIGWLSFGFYPKEKDIKWGVNFSQKHSQDLGLDWQENYLALLDDLQVRNLKIAVHWDLIEPKEQEYSFDDLDWQITEAQKRNAALILVVGMKTSRWPECHIPSWASNLDKTPQQDKILALLQEIVLRYKDNNSIWAWQVENEPFFAFGLCPWQDKDFLDKEIALVKSLDSQKRPVIISDSGEWSLWLEAARRADIMGATIYRKAWLGNWHLYFNYPFSPAFYYRKTQIIKWIFGKKVICVELQAEPWGPELLYYSPLEEQKKTMNFAQFRKNISFAEKTGLKEFYLWGVEWWYWMKEKQGDASIWNEAKKLFK